MRIFIFLSFTTLFCLTPKHVVSQNDKIYIDKDVEISVDDVFKIIKEQTDFSFVYHEDLFNAFPQVKLKKGAIRLIKLLNQTLSDGNIKVIFTTNNTILLKEKNVRQQRQVSGVVKDQSDLPIPGATVLIKGTSKGAATDINGRFTITVPDPAHILVFSSLGFESKEITVGNQVTVNVVLKESFSALDEVTIEAGYYKTSQRVATGNISKIEAKTIEKQPVNNPLSAMQGHLPGVNIIQNTGVPGGGYRINIRGQNFIDEAGSFGTSNDPLYIVDGVPFASTSLEVAQTTVGGIIGGGLVSPLNTINPADIKSIEVLKDADATAIYGARGANGVVLITTKKGKEGKTQVKVNFSTTLSKATGFIDLMNTQQYLAMRNEALENSGYTLENATPDIINRFPDLFTWEEPNRYTDWQEVLIGNTAYRQNAQLSLSGGSEYTQFLLSGGYSSETTVFPGDSKYDKTSLGINLTHQSKDERFNLNFSGSYNSDTNNLPGNDFANQARILPPNAPALYDDQGNINYWGGIDGSVQNPIALLEANYKVVTRGLIANTVLSYRPIPALEFSANFGYTDYRLESYYAQPHTMFDTSEGTGNTSETDSRLTTNDSSRFSWIIEPQINWKQNWGDMSIKLLAGATFQQNKGQQLTLVGQGFSSNILLLDIKAAHDVIVQNNTESEYKYQAFFGRLNFNLKDTYILNLTGRRDGSSRFGPSNRFGYFGAIGGAYIFSEDLFLKDNSIINFGKLRASYGNAGSDTSGNYEFYDTYEVADLGSLSPIRLFNPHFSWEEVRKLEVALELGFLKNRIFLSAAWYRNRSYNQLIDESLPATTGFSGINTNFDAVVENKGFEFDLRSTNIQTDHFKWSTTFNISTNRNKLIDFPGIESSPFAISRRLVIGESLNMGQFFRYLGVDPETGIYQFEDYNNDGVLNRDDRVIRFDFQPEYFGGLGNTFNYKNLQLNIFLQFKKTRKSKYERYIIPGSIRNIPLTLADYWQKPGDQSSVQGVFIGSVDANNATNSYIDSDAIVVDGSFIRLRNVSLNYTIPKTFMKGCDLSVYLQGQNLFVLTPFANGDPEATGSAFLPPLQQFTMGVNLSF